MYRHNIYELISDFLRFEKDRPVTDDKRKMSDDE